MNKHLFAIIGTVITLFVGGAISYGLAKFGEPVAYWWWHNVFGIM